MKRIEHAAEETPRITVYHVRVRTPGMKKYQITPAKMTIEQARALYGEGNYELLAWSEERISPDDSVNPWG